MNKEQCIEKVALIELLIKLGLSETHANKMCENVFISGYKHCEKTMYSEEQLQAEICKHNSQTIENYKK